MPQSKAIGNVFKLNDVINVKSPESGAKGDGTTDDTAALNLAFAKTGRIVFLPKGNYKVTANLTEPVCSQIIGEGSNDSTITAAAGVTKVFSLAAVAGAHLTKMAGFAISGNATTNARGMVVGDGAVAGGTFEDVWCHGFTGTGAIACYVRNVVGGLFIKCTFSDSTVNLQIEGTTDAWPTQTTFLQGGTLAATTKGVNLLTGRNIIFKGFNFEGNLQEGFYSQPVNGAVLRNIVLEDCWFEGNYPSDITQHQVLVDGSLVPAEYTFRIVRGQHVSGPGTAKSIKINGNVLFDIDDVTLVNDANNPKLTIAGAAFGRVRLGPLNAAQYTGLVSATGLKAMNCAPRSAFITLRANQVTTDLTLGDVTYDAQGIMEPTTNTRILLTPITATAAAGVTGTYVSNIVMGTGITITHPNTADVDKTFHVAYVD